MWHQKYSLPCTKVLRFVACRFTSKFLGIGAVEHSWGVVKTIKYGKRFSSSSYASEKTIIVYTYFCIKSARIEQYYSDKQLNDNFSSHTWNEGDDAFHQQLEKWGVGKKNQINQNLSKDNIEDWGTLSMKKNDQRTRTCFLAKYGGLSLYDIDFGKEIFH